MPRVITMVDVEAVFERCKGMFGVTSDATRAGWLLPDGSMLDFGRGGDEHLEHYHIGRCLPYKGDFLFGSYMIEIPEEKTIMPANNWFAALGAIRVNFDEDDRFNYVSATADHPLTSMQERVLRDWCEVYGCDWEVWGAGRGRRCDGAFKDHDAARNMLRAQRRCRI